MNEKKSHLSKIATLVILSITAIIFFIAFATEIQILLLMVAISALITALHALIKKFNITKADCIVEHAKEKASQYTILACINIAINILATTIFQSISYLLSHTVDFTNDIDEFSARHLPSKKKLLEIFTYTLSLLIVSSLIGVFIFKAAMAVSYTTLFAMKISYILLPIIALSMLILTLFFLSNRAKHNFICKIEQYFLLTDSKRCLAKYANIAQEEIIRLSKHENITKEEFITNFAKIAEKIQKHSSADKIAELEKEIVDNLLFSFENQRSKLNSYEITLVLKFINNIIENNRIQSKETIEQLKFIRSSIDLKDMEKSDILPKIFLETYYDVVCGVKNKIEGY